MRKILSVSLEFFKNRGLPVELVKRGYCLQKNVTVQQNSAPPEVKNELETAKNDFTLKKEFKVPPELRLVLPDFMPEPDWTRRNSVAEKLERLDMLRRRQVIDIPEFYIGSVLAITTSDEFAPKSSNRFVGICIFRDDRGLRHHVTLRNVVDGMGVEVRYNVYNPLIQKIEVLKLEKRLDDHLLYLRDALPEYSTIPFNMEPVTVPPGAPVPVNPIKVKLRPPKWSKYWYKYSDLKGIEDTWSELTVWHKKRYQNVKFDPWRKYDMIAQYKRQINKHDQKAVYDDLIDFENRQIDKISGKKSSFLTPLFRNTKKINEN